MLHSDSSELIRKGSVEEIVAHRDRALELAQQGFELLIRANEAYEKATCDNYSMYSGFGHSDWYSLAHDTRVDWLMEKLTKTVDQTTWLYLLEASGLRNLMDAETIKKFNEQVKKSPPAMTLENVKASFHSLWETRNSTFRQGLVNVFKTLLRQYKTHDAFKIGKKVILDRVLSAHGGWSFYSSGRERIADLDRIFHILDGKEPKDHRGDASSRVYTASSAKLSETETDYFTFKLYQNGNVHMVFKRLDLVDKANQMIAQHFGEVLPAG